MMAKELDPIREYTEVLVRQFHSLAPVGFREMLGHADDRTARAIVHNISQLMRLIVQDEIRRAAGDQ